MSLTCRDLNPDRDAWDGATPWSCLFNSVTGEADVPLTWCYYPPSVQRTITCLSCLGVRRHLVCNIANQHHKAEETNIGLWSRHQLPCAFPVTNVCICNTRLPSGGEKNSTNLPLALCATYIYAIRDPSIRIVIRIHTVFVPSGHVFS